MEHKVMKTDFFKKKTTPSVNPNAEEKVKKEAKVRQERPMQPPPKREKISQKNAMVIKEATRFFADNNMQTAVAEIDRIIKEVQKEHFSVAVVGEFSRGKSSFVNHLLGKECLPVGNLPTTAMLTRIRYNKDDMMAVFNDKGQRVKALPLSEHAWDDFVADNFNGQDPKGMVMLGVNNPWIRDNCLEIIDTPGAGDLEESRAKVIGEALLGSDGAIITISATSPLSESEQLFIEQRLIAKKIPFLMLIVTKLDLVPISERSKMLSYIQQRLSLTKGKDIPVFVPYEVEMPDHRYDSIIGMDKVKKEILSWMYHPERAKLSSRWLAERMNNVFDIAKNSINEQICLANADEDKRQELIRQKKEGVIEANRVWLDLQREMQERYKQCMQVFDDKVADCTDAVIERLQHEAKRSQSPYKWWQEDYPYRVKIELTNMAVNVENTLSKKIAEDSNWLNKMLTEKFKTKIMVDKQTIVERDAFCDTLGKNENIELEDLTQQREITRIGTAALTIIGSLAGLGIFATTGVSTGAGIITERYFRGKIEEQQNLLQDKVAEYIPKIVTESTEQSKVRIWDVYEQIINQADAEGKAWVDAQNEAIENSVRRENAKNLEALDVLMKKVSDLQSKLL